MTPQETTPITIPVIPTVTTEQMIESAKSELKAVVLGDVAQILAKYEGITITGVNDIEGRKKADEARKELKKYRTTIEAKRKQLKSVALKYEREIDATAKAISAPFEKRETEIENMITAVERAEREAKEKAERERIEKFNARASFLFGLGFLMGQDAYMFNGKGIKTERLQNETDEQWATTMDNATKYVEKVKAEQAETAAKLAKLEAMEAREEVKAITVEPEIKEAYQVPNFGPIETVLNPVTFKANTDPIAPIVRNYTTEAPTVKPECYKKSPSELHLEQLPIMRYDDPRYESDRKYYRLGYEAAVEYIKFNVLTFLSDQSIKSRTELKTLIESL